MTQGQMVHRQPSPPEAVCTGFECLLAEPLALFLFAAGTGVFVLLLALAIAHLTDARDILAEERSRIRDEAEAFASFADRIAEIDVSTAGAATATKAPGATTVLDAATTGGDLARVRDAYDETVMSVPHYEDEYREPLAMNMGIEFGEDVASAVQGCTGLTPQLKRTLVERSRTAHDQRVTLLGQLEGEAEALDDAERELAKVRRSARRVEDASLEQYGFHQLTAEWHLLSDRKRECEAVLTERQESIRARDRETRRVNSGPTFEEYLYDPLEVTYPVLDAGTELLERVRDARERVENVLATRA